MSADNEAVTKLGRPTAYTAELADEICERTATGEALIVICRDDHMPGETTVRRWAMFETPITIGFSARYAQAREIGAMARIETIHELARMEPRMIETSTRSPGGEVRTEKKIDPAFEQWRKTQIDTLKWEASKVLPKIYGDRIAVDHTVSVDPKNLTDGQLAAIISRAAVTLDGTAETVSDADGLLAIAAE